MKTTRSACTACGSTSCRAAGSPACRERARKADLAAYESRKAAEAAATPKGETYDEMITRSAAASRARAEAERAALFADPAKVSAALDFERVSADAAAEQRAAYLAAGYHEVETAAQARDADRAREENE